MHDREASDLHTIKWEHPELGQISVGIVLKKMNSLRIHVSENGDVWVSAPIGTPIEKIKDSLSSGSGFIAKARQRQLARPRESERGIGSVTVLGREYPVRLIHSGKAHAEIADGEALVFLPDAGDERRAKALLDAALRRDMLRFFNDSLSRLYPVVAAFGAEKPTVSVRRMKTLWGSCSKQKLQIHLNVYLYEAPPECVDYVMMHELTHLLYGDHGRDFYRFMDGCMPDWKRRKALLDASVVIPI